MRIPAAAFALTISALPLGAQPLPGNPTTGLDLARNQCAECHYVERDWADLQVNFAPDFVEIANSDHSTLSLQVYLRTPHATMPNIILTDNQRDDIIAYILTLKREE